MRDGLFAVGVFACAHGCSEDGHVPVIRSSDYHGVDSRVVQNLTVVAVFFGVGAVLRLRFLAARFVDVTDGHDIVLAGFVEEAQQILAAMTGADRTYANAIVGADDAAVRGGAGGQRGGGSNESATVYMERFSRGSVERHSGE